MQSLVLEKNRQSRCHKQRPFLFTNFANVVRNFSKNLKIENPTHDLREIDET